MQYLFFGFPKRLSLLIALLISIVSYSQGRLNFKQISVEEGIKNSRVVSVTQDKEGFMWFATHDGLEKYNGTDFKHYSLSYIDGDYIKDDIINCLELSPNFDLLCGTKNGNLYHYNRTHDRFEKLLQNKTQQNIYNIHSVYSNNDHEIWIGSTSGFFNFNTKTKKLTPINGISTKVNCITPYINETLLLGTPEGLYQIDIANKQKQTIKAEEELLNRLAQEDIMVITATDQQHLLAGTRSSEIYKLGIEVDSLKLVAHQLMSKPDSRKPIYDIVLRPGTKQYTIAIDGVGLLFTDTLLNQTDAYYADHSDNSLSSNGIYEAHYSNDGVLWLASYGGGINMADPNKKKFKIARRIPHKKTSLRNNTVNAILEIDNAIWFGTKNGISILQSGGDHWKHIPPLSKSLTRPFQVMSMCLGDDNTLWVATYGRGLLKINLNTYQREQFSKANKDWKQIQTNHLYQVIKDSNGKIWCGGIWGGISVIDTRNQTNEVVNITNVRSLYELGDQIYVGTLFGIFIVDKNTYEISRPQHELLTQSRVISMQKHPVKEQLYIGTDIYGLHVLDLKTDSLFQINSKNQLPTNYIRSILFDDQNHLWLSTTGGLALYNDSIQQFDSYNISDGLASTEFSENAALKHSSGQLIYGGSRGVSWFNPKDIIKSKQVVKPIFTSFELFGERVAITDEGPLYENINLQKSINLPHNQNSVSFGFGSICYTNPQNVRYKWILDGLEDNWNGPSTNREAIYSKLPPGQYTFKVMVSNDDGAWQQDIKSIQLTIDKPFWKTPIAYFIYAIVLVILVLLNMHYYYTIVQERHSAEKQQFFISIAHDLRTPLSLIKLPVEKLIANKKESDIETQSLNLVKRNVDRLTNMVNQLLDFQKSDLNKMQLQVELIAVLPFINDRLETFKPLAKEKNITIEIEDKDDNTELWVDSIKFEKIMFNLLSNALKYTPEGGSIKISTDVNQKYAIIHVEDNGEGIPANQQKNIFQRYYRASNAINSREVGSGVGLMLTKQLVELHGGQISFVSEVKVGSTFTIMLPLGDAHFSDEHRKLSESELSELTPIINPSINTTTRTTDGPKLLIVEDNPELLESLAAELQNQYQVSTAQDGAEGLSKALNLVPDIIISDVMMPKMNGHQLCTRLKNEISTCHIPIILLTALDSPDYKREGLEYGADAYMEKPFDMKLLRVQIDNLLKNRQLLRSKLLEPSSEIEAISPTNTDQQFLIETKEFIISNIDSEKLTVENMASELGMSRPVLYRKIKSLTDLSPQQFLMTVKLKEAGRIMKEEGHNISETAYMVGFSDPKYFSQTFKKYFGMTPSEYLKQ